MTTNTKNGNEIRLSIGLRYHVYGRWLASYICICKRLNHTPMKFSHQRIKTRRVMYMHALLRYIFWHKKHNFVIETRSRIFFCLFFFLQPRVDQPEYNGNSIPALRVMVFAISHSIHVSSRLLDTSIYVVEKRILKTINFYSFYLKRVVLCV